MDLLCLDKYVLLLFAETISWHLKKQGSSIIFHSFPKGKDLVSSTIQKEWVHCCRRNDKFNINTSRVCSEHFTVNDYERDLEHELLARWKKADVMIPKPGKNLTLPSSYRSHQFASSNEQNNGESDPRDAQRKDRGAASHS
ncbi:hypothetical protein NQ315_005760 [Exocentrus adspersus]|uniref:THAP-type domain-containing protein n=1 Tax=Exocentrus adspersus TaxID=1586481 RepID=A0AAV8VCN1_9CUCU|nr:hypothetical protein NQ315_005760 [Exocentrus adspersus]